MFAGKFARHGRGSKAKTSGRTGPRWYLLLVAIIALGLLLSYLMYSGPDPWYDDSIYIFLAHEALSGNASFIGSRFAYGFLKLFPLAASFGLLGYGNFQAVLPSVLEYVLLIIMTFLIGKKLQGERLGVIAAFLAATAPFAVSNATRVLPDIVTGLALSVSIYLFLASTDTKHSVVLPILFGASTALPLFFNEEGFATMLFSWVYVAFLLVSNTLRIGARRAVTNGRTDAAASVTFRFVSFAAVGTVACLSAYFIVFYVSLGSPFFVFTHYNAGFSPLNPFSEAYTLLFGNFLNAGTFTQDLYPIGPLSLLAMAGSVLFAIRSGRRGNFISFLNWSFVMFMIFGTTSLAGGYHPIPVTTRFFGIVLSTFSLLAAFALLSFYDYAKKTFRRRAPSYPAAPLIVMLLLLFAITLACLPLYGMLIQSNRIILQNNQELYQSTRYATSVAPAGEPIAVYTDAFGGFGFILPLFLSFTTGFNASITYQSIVDYGSNNTLTSCALASGSSPFLIVEYQNVGPAAREQIDAQVSAWLSDTCTATLLTEINQTYIYSLSGSTQG